MKQMTVDPAKSFDLTISDLPGDKSISHRCAIFSLLSRKPSRVSNYLRGEDTMNSLKIAQSLGLQVEDDGKEMILTPPEKMCEPSDVLDCGNAGTAIRLYAGFLSSLDGFFVLSGDEYLRRRPMRRVADPLRAVGAQIDGREGGNLAPLAIRGAKLKPFDYSSPVASAQVKSALILAGIRSDGVSFFQEPELSRDHTEKMLRGMGAMIEECDGKIAIHPIDSEKLLEPLDLRVPGDPSSAFFFAVAAAITPGATVKIENVLLNPTRIEAFEILKKMGAKIEYLPKESTYEEVGDVVVSYQPLQAVEVSERISWLIDELPALAIAMACAEGTSVVKNAKELRVKESDRIASVVNNIRLCGIETEEREDGYTITGGELRNAQINSFGDHRIAMSFAIAGLRSGMEIKDIDCINTSFPNFLQLMEQIKQAT